jgi:hypothetical protein
MADDGGGNAFLGLILGGLLVFVVLIFALGWGFNGQKTASIESPKISRPVTS